MINDLLTRVRYGLINETDEIVFVIKNPRFYFSIRFTDGIEVKVYYTRNLLQEFDYDEIVKYVVSTARILHENEIERRGFLKQ